MAKTDFSAPGMTIAEVEAAIAAATDLSVSAAAELTLIDQLITACGQAAATWEGRGFWWSRKKKTFTTVYAGISNVARSSNVATLTTGAAHGLVVGCRVRIAGVTTAGFDADDAVVASVADTTHFTYANAGDDVGSTADATGTAAGHAYPLRTINSSAMTDLYVPQAALYGTDWPLAKTDRDAYDEWIAFHAAAGGNSEQYALWEEDGALMMGLVPPPSSATVVTIPYIRRHSKITSAGSNDAALIVPAEFHWAVYVDGPIWLVKHRITDPASLAQCPSWIETMQRMAAADPTNGYGSPAVITYPTGVRSWDRDGGHYTNSGNLSI